MNMITSLNHLALHPTSFNRPIAVEPSKSLLPQVHLVGQELHCDGRIVPLFGKRLTLDLIRMFLHAKDLRMSRDEVLNQVYRVNPARLSRGFLQSRRASVLKLISRSREILSEGLAGSPGELIRWFAYRVETRQYELYRMDDAYILAKLKLHAPSPCGD